MSGIYQQYLLEELDPFGVLASLEEAKHVHQYDPVYKDTFSSKGGELFLPSLQFPKDILRKGL